MFCMGWQYVNIFINKSIAAATATLESVSAPEVYVWYPICTPHSVELATGYRKLKSEWYTHLYFLVKL